MKKDIAIAFVALCAMCAVAVEMQGRIRPRRASRPSGGIVEKARAGNAIHVVNAQSVVPGDVVERIAGEIRRASQLPVDVRAGTVGDGGDPISAAAVCTKAGGVGAAVLVVSDGKLPMIVSSPDGRWAILNVGPIASDAPRAEGRFRTLLWNAVAWAIGAGRGGDRASVLAPFSGLAELDAVSARDSGPVDHNRMVDVAAGLGIKLVTFASYRTACAQGWAPLPTNEVQKAIWDEVHAVPKNPIKVEFDPKQGR
ncbi:MAG: hypothetical protein ACI4RA_07120 [Kiritimatiellia bacterium]